MLHLADEDAVARFDPSEAAAGVERADPGHSILDAAFQTAIRRSLLTGTAVDLYPQGLALPESDAELPRFCEQALSGCPTSMELWLLDGRRVQVSLNWIVGVGSAMVSLRAVDATEQKRKEELEAAQRSQQQIDRMIEQSQAQKKLRDSEERYRASFEQAAMGILHTSFDGRIIRCNRRFGEMIGYAPEELKGRAFQEITPPGDRPPSREAFEKLISGAVANASFEKRYVRKDGSQTWVNLTITTQRDSEGRPLHFITMVEDINARKEAEERLALAQESLRKSEERYRTAFLMTMDAVALNRASDGAYMDCNLAFLNLTGYKREEVIGRRSIDLGVWNDVNDREKMLEILKRSGMCRNLEAQFRKKDGGVIWGLMSASIVELDGEACLLSVTRDMSEAKIAENEIRRLAYYDPLTGLPNRRALLERLQQAMTYDRRNSRKRALLFLDLDNFKTLNDTLGHHAGDLLLQEVARRITSCIRETDTASRIGGDEFVVMIENLSDSAEEAAAQAKNVAEKILARIAEPYTLLDRECVSTSSIGITVFGYSKKAGPARFCNRPISPCTRPRPRDGTPSASSPRRCRPR